VCQLLRQDGALPMIKGMESVADQLRALKAPRILIKAAEWRNVTKLECEMPECLCPVELGGRTYFEPARHGHRSDWAPTNDHYPVLKCDGGRETVDNSRAAHRLCNRVDYSKRIGRSYAKDLAIVEAARQEALRRRT
jgi:hypothetical protein